jgi:methionyl-tRNA synthetase
MDRFLVHDALAAVWEFVSEANRFVDQEQPWALAKQMREGDVVAAERLGFTLGDLLEACRLISVASAPVIPGASQRVWQQLGLEWPYRADGGGGPRLEDALAWGASWMGGKVGQAEILFPRVEMDET